ncbi:MAG: hypothetical protein ABF313_08320 [Marivita sp.]
MGGQLGCAYGDFNININTIRDFNEDNVIGGITAGYLWSIGNSWLLGPEFKYDFTDISANDTATGGTTSLDGSRALS